MNTGKKTIRILAILLSSVWGIFFGILAPIVIMTSDMGIASHYALRIWIIAAVAGYFAPCFLMMLDKSKIAAVSAVTGTALTLFVHSVFSGHAQAFMYLPQIFMTILAILYVFVTNPYYLGDIKQKRKERLNAPAPSILDKHEYRGDDSSPENPAALRHPSKKGNKRRKK
jgi:hypothetical protein